MVRSCNTTCGDPQNERYHQCRIPPAIEQKLADYCVKRGVTRTQVVTRALDHYLDQEAGGASPYSLAADLIPPRGAKKVQSSNVREFARKAFRGSRAR